MQSLVSVPPASKITRARIYCDGKTFLAVIAAFTAIKPLNDRILCIQVTNRCARNAFVVPESCLAMRTYQSFICAKNWISYTIYTWHGGECGKALQSTNRRDPITIIIIIIIIVLFPPKNANTIHIYCCGENELKNVWNMNAALPLQRRRANTHPNIIFYGRKRALAFPFVASSATKALNHHHHRQRNICAVDSFRLARLPAGEASATYENK